MCGIAGILSRDPALAHAVLPQMVAAQTHRGPDDCGVLYDTLGEYHVAFGFRRLAILDLTPTGHQPMVHPVTGDVLIFNGEIYNFRRLRKELEALGETFTSTGDTEVLLRALVKWGKAALSRLEGMFALAFFERKNGRILLARDPVGMKPLYIAETANVVLFASEVRAILASGLVPKKLLPAGVASLLAFGAVQEPATLFRGIRLLESGTWQEFNPAGHGAAWLAQPPKSYWDYPTTHPAISVPQAVADVRETLSAAVRDHLESDVPVGVFLSSGLDSTLIAALGAKYSPLLRIAPETRFDSILAPNAGLPEVMPEASFPARVLVMPREVGFQAFEVFVNERRSQFTQSTVDDKALVNFHVQAVGGIAGKAFKGSFTAAEQQDRGKRKPAKMKAAPHEVKAFRYQISIGRGRIRNHAGNLLPKFLRDDFVGV